MTSVRRLLAALLLFPAADARADLSFLQVVQAQTSQGRDGIFGKTWVEVSGRRMRLVSGYASRIPEGGSEEEPRRIVQIIDLDRKSRTLVYPDSKTFSLAPFSEVDYDARVPAGADAAPSRRLEVESVTLGRRGETRVMLGATCEHWRLRVRVVAIGEGNERRRAVMDQDLWVAPVAGALSDTLLDLIAFENAYRDASGGDMSPLDHERYQLRAAAGFLDVPVSDLKLVPAAARKKVQELPSYALASSVSWWSPDAVTTSPSSPPAPRRGAAPGIGAARPEPPKGVPLAKLSPLQVPPYARPRHPRPPPSAGLPPPRFKVIDWRHSERIINRMYLQTRGHMHGGGFALGPMPKARILRRKTKEAPVYDDFQRGLQSILDQILATKEEPAHVQGAASARAPFYEVYTELHGLEASTEVPQDDFALPPDYKEVPYGG